MAHPPPHPGLSLFQGLPQFHGRPLKLPPKERAALGLLMQRRPQPVRKDEFAQRVWSGGEMSDETLARCISRLRQALQPHGLKIEAVYGLGYQLVGMPAGPSTEAGPPDRQAMDSYAHARQLMQQRTPAAMGRAVELLRCLVQDAPGFAPARVALADALAVSVGWGQLPTAASVDEGLAALAPLADDAPAAPGLHAAQGALLDMAWRFAEARRCFDQALAQDADNTDTLVAYARHLLYSDQAAAAAAVLRRVRQLAPHALHVRTTLARALVQGGAGDEALAEAQAALADHPGQLIIVAFALSLQALVAPRPELQAAAWRLTQGPDAPPFAWTVAAYVLSRLQQREATLDIVDTALLCTRMTAGEASLYAAPLAALGEYGRAATLLQTAVQERSGMMAMVLRDPAHAHWLPGHAVGRSLLRTVFGPAPAHITR